MQAGTHWVFLSENFKLPFLSDSTGHWGAIRNLARTGFSSAKTSSRLFYRTRPAIGARYVSRYAPGFPQRKPPAAFLSDSTGHWSAICKPVRTGFSSAKTSSCLFGGLDRTSGRETQAGIPGPLKSVPLCGTPYFFTIHSSLFTQLSPAAGFPCRRAFLFFFLVFSILILTFIYLCGMLSHRQSSM